MTLLRRVIPAGGTLLGILYPLLIFIAFRWVNVPRLFLFWPTLVSLGFLFSFGRTLWFPPPFVERLARLQNPQLSDAEVTYCRHVTQVWCGFFIMNGGIALALALKGSLKAWTVYAGGVSYLLIGMVFTLEYLYRRWRFGPKSVRA